MIRSWIATFLFLLLVNQALTNTDDHKIISRYPRSILSKYKSYSSVMILHYYIPADTIQAKFEFRASDARTSMDECIPRNVSIHLKHGSYPVISPEGIPFPKTFLNISRPEIHELIVQNDEEPSFIDIPSPKVGDWFAVSFVSWTDPKQDGVEQGSTSQCNAYIYSQLSILEQKNIKTVTPNNRINLYLEENKDDLLKFHVDEHIDHILFEIDVITPCKYCENIIFYLQSTSIPNEDKYQDMILLSANQKSKKYFYFSPEEDSWHYLNIKLSSNIKKDYSEIGMKLKYISSLRDESYTAYSNVADRRINSFNEKLILKNNLLQYSLPYKQYNLMRIGGAGSFLFEYNFDPSKKDSSPSLLYLSSQELTVLKFRVREIMDIGGTISLGLAINPVVATSPDTKKYKIVACIGLNSLEIPSYPNLCTSNDNITTKAPITLDSSSKGVLDLVHLPYPDPGTYYLSILAFFDNDVSCNISQGCKEIYEKCVLNCEIKCAENCNSCTEECERYIVEENDVCTADETCLGADSGKSTSVIFSVSSHPCIDGSCGNTGICKVYMKGGFVFSSCFCTGGYRGWDCSDGSNALSASEVLTAVLLLTLSNLLFIPGIYFAYRRSYYTEAVAYFCSMVSSTFYHACDAKENQYGYCILPLDVLQFSDFYCALLAIWVTLVAMSHMPNRYISIAHIAGAVFLAISVTYNLHAIWVVVLPAVLGILLVGVNWGIQCRKTNKLFPSKKYLKFFLPIGGALVAMGLINFTFLGTKENYKVVHSLWHILMAISLIFLIPNSSFLRYEFGKKH